MKKIENPIEFEEIAKRVGSSDDSYIREAYFVSKTYIKENYIVAPNSLGMFKILIVNPEDKVQVDLLFEDVSQVSFSLEYMVTPSLMDFSDSSIAVSLTDNASKVILARVMYYAISNLMEGNKLKYGKDEESFE